MNNLLDSKNEDNFLFISSVIAVLCEKSPLILNLKDIEKYWMGDIQRLSYDLNVDLDMQTGTITFKLLDDVDDTESFSCDGGANDKD